MFTDRLGLTDLVEHRIILTDERPINRPAYRIPSALAELVDAEITRLLQQQIIRPSDTPYSTGVVPIVKHDGSIRITCDWRAINAKTVPDAYPPSDPNAILQLAANGRYLSKLDISKAYWQVKMAADSEKYTGFRTESGLFSFSRMGMGLSNSSKTLQRLLDRILRGCHRFAKSHLDDIILSTAGSWEEHMGHVRQVIIRLQNAGLTLHESKCAIGISSE